LTRLGSAGGRMGNPRHDLGIRAEEAVAAWLERSG
jgi:hypothetical protein